MLDNIQDIPNDIKPIVKIQASEAISRINALFFGDAAISQCDGLKYYVDMNGITYDIIDDDKNKFLYSVIKINKIRFVSYVANIYGYYNGMPVKDGSYNWTTNINTQMYDLYYRAV